MALFKSGNPALGQKAFKNVTFTGDRAEAMTVNGTLGKFGFMMVMLMAGALYTWYAFSKGQDVMPFVWGGAIGGLVLAIVISFKKEWAPFLAPAYAIAEGLFVGAISAYYNYAFAESGMPGIVTNAVGLTMGTAIAMFLLYRFGIIRATQKFKAIIFTATAGIAVFYLIVIILRFCGVNVAFMNPGDASLLGIGISLFVVAIAALNLILDFDMIESGVQAGAPKYMEWYGAFGLMVTIVWLYLELLRLLSRFASRD